MNKKSHLIALLILSGLFAADGVLAQSLKQNLVNAQDIGSKAQDWAKSGDASAAAALSEKSFNELFQIKIEDQLAPVKPESLSSLNKYSNIKWVRAPEESHAYDGRRGDCDSFDCVIAKPFHDKQYEEPDPTGWTGFKNGFYNGWRSVMSFSDVSRNVLLLPKPAMAAVVAGSLLLSAVLLFPSVLSGLAGAIVGSVVGTSKDK